MTEPLRVITGDADAPPLLLKMRGGRREGYEPEATELVAGELGRPVEWVFRSWSEMVPTLLAGDGDAIWNGQGITEQRSAIVDFTRPYAIFDESVLVRSDSHVAGPDDLDGLRVAAIGGSTNMALAETFPGAVLVAFDGATDDVFGEMVAALRAGDVDAVVDDDVVTVPLDEDPELKVPFTVPTRNGWGVAVSKERPDLRDELDAALGAVIADGRLAEVWRRWIPGLPFPLDSEP
jgi:polar amino acid transport system substrate-binding protein